MIPNFSKIGVLRNRSHTFGLAFVFFIGSIKAFAVPHFPLPSESDCTFYLKLESELKCVLESRYLTDYGYYYCSAFQKERDAWSGRRELQTWMKKTTRCLQKELTRDRNFIRSCKLMEDTAFSSHSSCYVGNGFCELSYDDKQRILNLVSLLDYTRRQSLLQMFRVNTTCNMSAYEKFFHMVDYLKNLTADLDEESKVKGSQIIRHFPIGEARTKNYLAAMEHFSPNNLNSSSFPENVVSNTGGNVFSNAPELASEPNYNKMSHGTVEASISACMSPAAKSYRRTTLDSMYNQAKSAGLVP